MNTALLVLENGEIFEGVSIGKEGVTCGEIVFNTSMFGYQEVLTDPSYTQQIITFTYPHIGNVGINYQDQESEHIWASGIVIRNPSLRTSNWRATASLDDYLAKHQIIGIAGIDTRHLTHIIRDAGSQAACIMTKDANEKKAFSCLDDFIKTIQGNLSEVVTTKENYEWTQKNEYTKSCLKYNSTSFPYHIVVYDYGVKQSILRQLADLGCKITVVPATTPLNDLKILLPDGILLSNGPGDPEECKEELKIIKDLINKWNIPILGICLGHQLIALASGAKVKKMKFGHHGTNHPVKDIKTNRVYITSQNHGYAVDKINLPHNLVVTHVSLFDETIQGIKRLDKPVRGLQGHPEAGPGPDDMIEIFEGFLQSVEFYSSQSNLANFA